MTDLLPCPFCGGDGVIGWDEVYTPHGDLPGEKARVICEDCLAATDYRVDREEAIALWNRRVEPKVTDVIADAIWQSLIALWNRRVEPKVTVEIHHILTDAPKGKIVLKKDDES